MAQRPARGVAVELALLALEGKAEMPRPIAGGQPPYVLRIAIPAHRIGDAVSAVGPGRAAAVLEIVETLGAHHRVADAAEVDPHMAVLMTEQGPEGEVAGRPLASPETVVIPGPLVPQPVGRGVHRRAERQDIDHHPFVIAGPAGRD